MHFPSQAALHLMQITSWFWYRWIATWVYDTNIFPQLPQLALWSVILWWKSLFLPDNLPISLKVISHLSHLYRSIFHLHNFNLTCIGLDTSNSSELLKLFSSLMDIYSIKFRRSLRYFDNLILWVDSSGIRVRNLVSWSEFLMFYF